jgi:heat shock 70kDa protein 1/2/6/8
MNNIIGIDLGTTNSCAVYWKNNNANIVNDKFNNKTIPSIVAFNKNGRLSGFDAKNQIEKNPKNTIYDVKRLIGRKYSDDNVQNDISYFTYNIESNNKDDVIITSKYCKKKYKPEEISAIILQKIKNISSSHLNFEVKNVIITVPAYFNDNQRQATKNAAKIAGLNCIRVLNEPTAAALAYGLNNCTDEKNILVYDLGGGTLDVSLLNIDEGIFRVIATTGDTHLGGEDFDQVIYNYCIKYFNNSNNNIELKYYNKSLQKLRVACECCKINLSYINNYIIHIPDFYKNKNNNTFIDLHVEITRELFESLAFDLFKKSMLPVENIMNISSLNIKDINEIILVGGSTRIPKIKFNIHNFFNKKPYSSINPDTIVATGAAIQGFILSHEEDPFSQNILLIDVIPLSLGIKTNNNIMTKIIDRNTPIPVSKTQYFTTDSDNENFVEIEIYQGERSIINDNFLIGKMVLNNIENANKGIPIIGITFKVDANGIINIIAKDKRTGSSNNIIIEKDKNKIEKDELSKLIIEAKKFELEDDLRKQIIINYYTINDICNIINYNIKHNSEYKLSEIDSNIILSEVNKILIDINEKIIFIKEYLNIDTKVNSNNINDNTNDIEFDDMTLENKCDFLTKINIKITNNIKFLKNKYASLLLNMDNDTNCIIKSSNAYKKFNNNNNDNIYDTIEDSEDLILSDVQEHVENIKLNNDDTPERDNVIKTCKNVLQYIHSDKGKKLYKHNFKKIVNYINNIKLWLNVNVSITKDEYLDKVNEINICVNEIFETNETELNNSIINHKNELINLCNILSDKINNNNLPLKNHYTNILSDNIKLCYKWIELCKSLEDNNIIFYNKINELNNLCSSLVEQSNI